MNISQRENDMGKSLSKMKYTELLAERNRVVESIKKSTSVFLKRDYLKYLSKIDKELRAYRASERGK